jgi:hypothetical protein|tara:strand:+ start:367 stop:699 length:333 start_codon:yes stop_codon:yes gene_type:complete
MRVATTRASKDEERFLQKAQRDLRERERAKKAKKKTRACVYIRVYRKRKKNERKNMRGKRRGGKNKYIIITCRVKKQCVGYIILCFFSAHSHQSVHFAAKNGRKKEQSYI